MSLRPYQSDIVTSVAKKLASGKRRVVLQLPTGAGKTFCFSAISKRFIEKTGKKVLILVHRDELMNQAALSLYKNFDVISQKIDRNAKISHQSSMAYVGMIETVYNRLKKHPNFFYNIGLVIVDECHIGNFTKIYDFFPDQFIIGFSATPIAAKKKFPLNGMFDDIVCGPQISELIEQGSLAQNVTYNLTSVKRADLKVKGGEFSDDSLMRAFKTPKQLHNTIHHYKDKSFDLKTIVFNVNREHSEAVNEAFLNEGLNSRHLDAEAGFEYRKNTLEWFKKEPTAILNNIGIATTGFDEPTIKTVIVNRATMSLPLWLQMCGRGSRPSDGKEFFTILDLGGNAKVHGDWCDHINWNEWFWNPSKPSKGGGVAPSKECPQCSAIVATRTMKCPYCSHEWSTALEFDEKIAHLELITKQKPLLVDVKEVIEGSSNYKDYHSLHAIKNYIVTFAKHQWGVKEVDEKTAEMLLEMYHEKTKVWCKEKGKRFNQWHKDVTKEWLYDSLKKAFVCTFAN